MNLVVRPVGMDSGRKNIVVLYKKDAEEIAVSPLERVVLDTGKNKLTAVVNVTDREDFKGAIGVYDEVKKNLKLKPAQKISVTLRKPLFSKKYIREKVNGSALDRKKIACITSDIIKNNLNDLEMASFITAAHIHGFSDKELVYLTESMVKFSKKLKIKGKIIDKHSIGGIPGDKTTMLVVPIISATGIKFPKTSTKAITDPSGTADRVSVLMPNEFDAGEIEKIVEKANSCMVWDSSTNLNPADDLIIGIERPMNLDPLIIPSILSKKKIIGTKYVLSDLPIGKDAKLKNLKAGRYFGRKMIKISSKMGMEMSAVLTRADQPLGYSIGPALESREVLKNLENPESMAYDLREKVFFICQKIFKDTGVKADPAEILYSGKALQQMKKIIEAQNGNSRVTSKNIIPGKHVYVVRSTKSGYVADISNSQIVEIAKIAGAPQNKGAGVLLNKKIGDPVKRGETLFTIYAEHREKLLYAKLSTKGAFKINKKKISPKKVILSVIK